MPLIIPNTFASRSGSIRLSEIDDNFNYIINQVQPILTAITFVGTSANVLGTFTVNGNTTLSGTLTVVGAATGPTPTQGTNNTQLATTAFVQTAIGAAQAFPSGTKMIFCQAAAPTGWTQDVSDNANNRMFRAVNTAGGGVGGTHSPILNNVVPAHTHGITTGTESVDHSHSGTTGTVSSDHSHSIAVSGADDNNHTGNFNGVADSDAGQTTSRTTGGISANHTHGFSTGGRSAAHTHSGTTDNGSSQTNWTPRYIDTIICTKN